jgi:hypothetical protein
MMQVDAVLAGEELIRRTFPGGGTRVTNCVLHMGSPLTARPRSCELCSMDVQNQLALAIRINDWLNVWKGDAEQVLAQLLNLNTIGRYRSVPKNPDRVVAEVPTAPPVEKAPENDGSE